MSDAGGRIRVGIGGWSFPDWKNGAFYPPGWPATRELEYASRRLTAIEINGTFYGPQKPATFAKWRSETPEDFMFSVKAPRGIVQRRVLADTGEAVERFVHGGLEELGDKLGPLLWQLPPTRRFDPDDLDAFLALLPRRLGARALRHVLDVHHESFATPAFAELLRRHGAGSVISDDPGRPGFAEPGPGIAYVQLRCSQASEPAGYGRDALAQWARRLRQGAEEREVFVFFIGAAKVRNPAAAMALMELLAAPA